MTTAPAERTSGYWGRLHAQRSRSALRLFLRAFLPFLGVLLLAGAAAFSWRMSTLERELDATIDAFLELAGMQLQRDLQGPIEDLRFLSQELARLGATPAAAAQLGNLARARRRYAAIRVLDVTGIERIGVEDMSLNTQTQPADWSHSDAFTALAPLRDDDLYVSSFELRTEGGKILEPLEPIVRFAKPFADAAARHAGYVIIELDASEALGALAVADSNGFVELLTGEGYWVKARDPQLEWGAVLRERQQHLFSTRNARAWEAMKQQERGTVRTEQGGFWYRSIRPLEPSIQNPTWMLVLHETPARRHERAFGVATALAGLAVCAVLMAAPFYWWLARRAGPLLKPLGVPERS